LVQRQLKNPQNPQGNNPLGRVLAVYEQIDRDTPTDELERKLDEAILKELPSLQRGISTLKLIYSIAPLLGLLGTVTGMIVTFQTITLFGAGDPRLMAGGISQALVTTALGLIVAVPVVLCHSLVSSKAEGIITILEQQSAGLLAQRREMK
jgi:biopolymer transport protein ExbB